MGDTMPSKGNLKEDADSSGTRMETGKCPTEHDSVKYRVKSTVSTRLRKEVELYSYRRS